MRAPKNLLARLAEIVAWSRTGVLEGGALRRHAGLGQQPADGEAEALAAARDSTLMEAAAWLLAPSHPPPPDRQPVAVAATPMIGPALPRLRWKEAAVLAELVRAGYATAGGITGQELMKALSPGSGPSWAEEPLRLLRKLGYADSRRQGVRMFWTATDAGRRAAEALAEEAPRTRRQSDGPPDD